MTKLRLGGNQVEVQTKSFDPFLDQKRSLNSPGSGDYSKDPFIHSQHQAWSTDMFRRSAAWRARRIEDRGLRQLALVLEESKMVNAVDGTVTGSAVGQKKRTITLVGRKDANWWGMHERKDHHLGGPAAGSIANLFYELDDELNHMRQEGSVFDFNLRPTRKVLEYTLPERGYKFALGNDMSESLTISAFHGFDPEGNLLNQDWFECREMTLLSVRQPSLELAFPVPYVRLSVDADFEGMLALRGPEMFDLVCSEFEHNQLYVVSPVTGVIERVVDEPLGGKWVHVGGRKFRLPKKALLPPVGSAVKVGEPFAYLTGKNKPSSLPAAEMNVAVSAWYRFQARPGEDGGLYMPWDLLEDVDYTHIRVDECFNHSGVANPHGQRTSQYPAIIFPALQKDERYEINGISYS